MCIRAVKRRPRYLALICILVGVAGMSACAPSLPSRIASTLEEAGIVLERASPLAQPTIDREQATRAARGAAAVNEWRGQITDVVLVAVSGPGNPRLGFEPGQHSLAYAISWTGDDFDGFVLVSASTGEVLFVTAW
jgi:hypothetical protein